MLIYKDCYLLEKRNRFKKGKILPFSMYDDISIKIAETEEDLVETAILRHQNDLELISCFYELSALDIKEEITSQKKTFILARKGNTPIGYGAGKASEINPNSYWSEGIYVLPEYRNKGIELLIKKAQIEYAKNKGYELIATNIFKDNLPSIKVHEKLGFNFKPIGQDHKRAYLPLTEKNT